MSRKQDDLLAKIEARKAKYEPITGFAVIKVGSLFQPCRLHIHGNQVDVEPLHDASPYEALAYEYLQGDVSRHYEVMQIERSKPCSKQ